MLRSSPAPNLRREVRARPEGSTKGGAEEMPHSPRETLGTGRAGIRVPLEETATHSSILGWRIPWTEESMGSQGVEHY